MKNLFSLYALLILLIVSCSREKDTMVSRAYHNTTARYNGYFNAREIMREQEALLEEQQVDDYSQLLPIFIVPDKKKAQSMFPDMDLVIEKCSEVIDRHSMYIKREEHVKWIDDSYILIGKARFYKQEYGLAEETFLYVYQAFKRDERRYAGLNWLIRTYIETEEWDKAEEFIDLAEDERRKYPDDLLGMYHAAVADFWIRRDQDFPKAIQNLQEAIKYEEDKDQKRRLTFVLAQIYQEQRDYAAATRLYTQVLKLNPSYVMRFNARINRAIAYDVSTSGSDDIKKELRKMLKDAKNEEFRDQIYYALAEIALKEDDEPQAIEFLRKSTKFSVSNNRQKGLSYLKLADLFFDRPAYVKAQAHYDSTIQYLPEEHPEYYEAESKNNSLQELVKNLKVIERLDSLLAISQLDEKAREKKVKKLIDRLKKEEEQKKQAELLALRRQQEEATNQGFLSMNRGGGGNKGKWYFYNPSTMAMGLNEFKRIWGDRPLEDNWRRRSKSNVIKQQTAAAAAQEGEPEIGDNQQARAEKKYNLEEFLANIPSSVQEQLEAHGKVAEALFNVGTIFKESFNDKPSAIKSFERIIKQYDTSQYNLPAYYQLYRIYFLEGNQEQAKVYKDYILDNHPFSEYAYLIKNPEYAKQTKASKQKIEEFYEATYKLYAYGLYQDVIESCEKADQVFKDNHIQAKFDFLKAKAIGHERSKDEFRKALQAVIDDHPEDTVKDRAQYILNYMKNMGNPSVSKPSGNSPFEYKPDEQHFFVVSFSEGNPNGRQLKIKLANFNQSSFREKNLKFTTSALPNKTLYLVRTFDNEMDVMRYYSAVKNNPEITAEVARTQANLYIISLSNFRLLFKEKNEPIYLEFFGRKYPG